MNVGQTILNQLKSLDANSLMAWGSHKFMTLEKNQLINNHLGGLLFKVNGLRHKGHVLILLNGSDLYDIRIGKFSKNIFTQKSILNDVFVEDLIFKIDDLVEGYFEKGKSVYDGINLFENV